MNRSILIVICDFFLLSLLAFSTPDINKLAQPVTRLQNMATNLATGREDLSQALTLALGEERRYRDTLLAELAATRENVTQRNQQIQEVKTQLQTTEEMALRLQQQKTNLTSQITDAQSKLADAQARLAALDQQLRSANEKSAQTEAKRAEMEAEARRQAERAGTLEHQLTGLEQTNQLILAERSTLNTQLQLSEAKRESAVTQMTHLQGEVEVQRQVNSNLAASVETLATKSTALAQEIEENRELAPNEIFQQLTTNHLMASFYGIRKTIFRTETSKFTQTHILLASDGANTFAICHVQDTPLNLWNPGTDWKDLSGTLAHGAVVFPIDSVSFSATDPRILLIPIPAAEARALGCKVYRLSKDPFKFQDAFVAGTQESYYGECKFQVDLETPQYVKMDRNSLRGLFGKFNPSTGDLVLSKTGEVLGLMANNNYCLMLRSFNPGVSLRFGPTASSDVTMQTLATLYAIVSQMPPKLQ
jgi:parvulin-like peptidyl-prolyl isomerase